MEISLVRILALAVLFGCVLGIEVMLKYMIRKKSERKKKLKEDQED